jgi:hypothetical protein
MEGETGGRVRRELAVLLFMLSAAPLEAAFERSPIEPFSRGRRAGCFGQPGASFGSLRNPALSPGLTTAWVMGGINPSPFGLPELSSGFAAVLFPTSIGPVTADMSGSGFSLYREGEIRIGWGAPLSDDLTAGVRLTWSYLSIAGYGAASAPGLDAGIGWRPVPAVVLGWMVERANSPAVARFGERLPTVMLIEGSVAPFPWSEFWLEAREEPDFPAEIRIGCSLQIHGALLLRLSTCTNPPELTAGADILLDPAMVVYTASFHPVLGTTHSIGIALRLGS